MKTLILSWLVFHANKSKDKAFYKIKNRILDKYGRKTDTVVQFIEGKKCFSCGGTGNHTYYGWNGFAYDHAPCWNCNGSGWFKHPRWNWLDVIQFGKFNFHRPFATTYEAPTESVQQFEGYIEHSHTKHTDFALFIIFIMYEKGYLNRWYKDIGKGWRLYWWLPRNWINNTIHILKYGRKAYPFRKRVKPNYCTDDLPF